MQEPDELLECDLAVTVELRRWQMFDDYDPDDSWDHWRASVNAVDDSGRNIAQLGDADIRRLRSDSEADVDDMLDVDGELNPFYWVLADHPGGWVWAHRVTIDARWRNRGLGPWLLLEALHVIAGDDDLIVALPAAFETDPASPERPGADQRLRRLWARHGFEPTNENRNVYAFAGNLDAAAAATRSNVRWPGEAR